MGTAVFSLEVIMKTIAALLIGGALIVAVPASAQDKGNVSKQSETRDLHQRDSHRSTAHRVTYKRDYKSDQEEHQKTEELNQKYRGVPSSEAR
jgi:hypothetical protein